MILAFDIGNTNIVIGGFEKDKTIFLTRVATDLDKTEAEYAVLVKNILEIYRVERESIEGSIVSSVVPPLNNVLIRVMELICGKSPLVVAAVAALQKYPKPQIILDLGTATTFSVLDAKGLFRGVVIYPGVMVSFDALASRTAQLPRISFDEPKQVIGTTSVDSMQSGLIYGNAGMLDGLIERIEGELGEKCTVIATGGLSGKIVPHCKREIILDENLLLDGLRILYEKNQKKK